MFKITLHVYKATNYERW